MKKINLTISKEQVMLFLLVFFVVITVIALQSKNQTASNLQTKTISKKLPYSAKIPTFLPAL